jgi:glycosyltransferase involved in cell wall biosynthesis
MNQHSPDGLSPLLEFLRQMDAFVMPSRGGGFGLCGIEAMATGLPLVATNWSGPVEYLDPADSFPLAYRLVDAKGVKANHVRYFGDWAEPDYEHLRHLMRWLYEHPEEAAEKGRLAAERVHRNWTWDRVARQMVDDFDAIAAV